MSNQFPSRSSALTKQSVQSVLDTTRPAYPFRDQAPSTPTSTTEPPLIECIEDAIELVLTLAVLGAIGVGFIILLELMYPGWSMQVLEVARG